MVDEGLCKVFRQLTESESVRNTSMWLGSHDTEDHDTYILSEDKTRLVSTVLRYPESILNVFMELIANCLDQLNEYPESVNTFRITFDKDSGIVSVYNNGPSIPVAKVKDKKGEEIWIPELLCTRFLSGSNHDKSSESKRVSFGAHGIGIKGCVSMSKSLTVECVDKNKERGNKYYRQEIRNNNTIVNTPEIKSLRTAPADIRRGGTRFTYMLDYGHYKDLPDDIMDTIHRLFETRMYHTAGYSGIKIYFNDKLVPVNTPRKLCELYFGEEHVQIKLKHPSEWNLEVFVAPPQNRSTINVSIINGGYVLSGIHFKHIIDRLASDLRGRIERLVKDRTTWRKSLVSDNLSILIVGSLPDLKFNEQIKSDLKMKNHKEYFEKFDWPKAHIPKIWKILEVYLAERFIIRGTKKPKANRAVANKEKYYPARKLGTPDSDLLAFEGDSAQSSAMKAMSTVGSKFSRKNKGMFLLGGCPINVLKHVREKKINGKSLVISDKMLTNNVVWNDFMIAMNLQYGMDYSKPENFATLNYQRYTNVVDKDHHGMGKIAALMISNICYFWPELIHIPGFMGYMDTPIIRVFPQGTGKKAKKVLSFMNEEEFEDWSHKNFDDGVVKGMKVVYYKGLGAHGDKSCRHMFSNYDKLRISYTDPERESLNILNQYFGRDSAPRKILLGTPPESIPVDSNRSQLPISLQLNHYTKSEQRYNLLCKLNHWCDNQIYGHRRMLEGLLDHLDSGNKQIKVDQLAGILTAKYVYAHGQASAEGMLIYMAQAFVGARNIPLALPLSQHGTRFKSNDSAAPRYLYTKVNPIISLIFPKDDRALLTYIIEEGIKTIPNHMVPVIPLSILETNNLPGTGWVINKWARHIDDVVDNIKLAMDGKSIKPMRPWLPGWNGEVRIVKGCEWCVGTYKYDKSSNEMTITELPFGEKNVQYIFGSKKKSKVSEKGTGCLYNKELIRHSTIIDDSSDYQINIRFKLKPGAMTTIQSMYDDKNFDAVEKYFGLSKKMNINLNCMHDNHVRNYTKYEDIFMDWFEERRSLYPKRFDRRIIILKLNIQMLTSKLTYIKVYEGLKLHRKKRAEQDVILADAGFVKIDTARLKNPKVITSAIRKVVLGGDASYKYLMMTFDDMSEESIVKIRAKIEEYENELKKLHSPNVLNDTWMAEVNAVREAIRIGHTEGWVVDDYEY